MDNTKGLASSAFLVRRIPVKNTCKMWEQLLYEIFIYWSYDDIEIVYEFGIKSDIRYKK